MNNSTAAIARKLNIFISYASEDNGLAIALNSALTKLLGKDFAEIWLDIEKLRAGFDLSNQLRDQLSKTDVLIIIYTGQSRESHGFTGLEVGYFMGASASDISEIPRRIVPFYLEVAPATTSGIKGISFGIDRKILAMNPNVYQESLSTLTDFHPIAQFFRSLEISVDVVRNRIGLAPLENDTGKRLECVRELLKSTFAVLKTRKDTEVHPQKNILIEVQEDLRPHVMELPGTAVLTPQGAGTMAIFGLPDEPIKWAEFLHNVKDKYRPVWKDVIETVVISSLEGMDIDNSQMVISYNEQELYRLVLSRNTKYYDGRREFHLYFVEALRRNNFGSPFTTRLLKALGICCRFRFMFFERGSEFSANNISIRSGNVVRELARKLIRELNLLQRDSVEAHLDDPLVWAQLISWEPVREMLALYAPIDEKIRSSASNILTASDPTINDARDSLVSAIRELDDSFKSRNGQLIYDLALKMSTLPSHESLEMAD